MTSTYCCGSRCIKCGDHENWPIYKRQFCVLYGRVSAIRPHCSTAFNSPTFHLGTSRHFISKREGYRKAFLTMCHVCVYRNARHDREINASASRFWIVWATRLVYLMFPTEKECLDLWFICDGPFLRMCYIRFRWNAMTGHSVTVKAIGTPSSLATYLVRPLRLGV